MFTHLATTTWGKRDSTSLTSYPNFLLTEITFSFCRLFEKRPAQFLPEMVAAMKGNSTLKGLRLPGNRLGRDQTPEREEGTRSLTYKLLG